MEDEIRAKLEPLGLETIDNPGPARTEILNDIGRLVCARDSATDDGDKALFDLVAKALATLV